MRPVSSSEIIGLDRYQNIRSRYREAVIRHKADRRLSVGKKVTLVFEDRETLRFQIQEMVWIERISDPAKIQHEIDVYNELVPAANELSAALYIEITDAPQIRLELDRLIGIDEHVALVLGADGDEDLVGARFDPKQMEEDRISAVQYIRFVMTQDQADRFADPSQPLRIRIDHPNYAEEVVVPETTRASLTLTLSEDPAPLLDIDGMDVDEIGPAIEDELLHQGTHVRALRPANRPGPDLVIVEALESGGDLAAATPELLREALAVVQRFAAEMSRVHGNCRVQTDLGPGVDRLRWHIQPRRP